MAKLTAIELLDFKTSSNQKMFQVSCVSSTVTYFSNVEPDDTVFNQKSHVNKCCISSDSGVIHNLYDSRYTLIHALAARRHRYPYCDDYDYQHIYKGMTSSDGSYLSNSIKSIAQAQGCFYAIDSRTDIGHYYINDEMYSWLCRVNGYAFPKPTRIHTMLYDQKVLSGDLNAALSCIDNIKYNTLYEIPGSLKQDYSSGAIIGTAVKCKNQYDHQYTMKHIGDNLLSCAREYEKVCNCNDLVYLKYRDSISYLSTDSDTQNHRFASEDKPNYSNSQQPQFNYVLPHIEVLKNINRGASASNHKSTLYSIDVKARFLQKFDKNASENKIVSHEKISANIKREIKNCIRQLMTQLAPANTQLFAVTVE